MTSFNDCEAEACKCCHCRRKENLRLQLCQYLYFCTSKASKVRTWSIAILAAPRIAIFACSVATQGAKNESSTRPPQANPLRSVGGRIGEQVHVFEGVCMCMHVLVFSAGVRVCMHTCFLVSMSFCKRVVRVLFVCLDESRHDSDLVCVCVCVCVCVYVCVCVRVRDMCASK